MTGAHPRSRGENRALDTLNMCQVGSSPLTRGKRQDRVTAPRLDGLIPAHAGKTEIGCGVAFAACGSSPLTRGKRQQAGKTLDVLGLIPAHAGKTRSRGPPASHLRAHPRSRGENNPPTARAVTHAGSSPLTRGKPGSAMRPVMVAGLIPAHAGKTAASGGPTNPGGLIPAHAGKTSEAIRRSCLIWAHPRSRGENVHTMVCPPCWRGSSPLTRGKRRL